MKVIKHLKRQSPEQRLRKFFLEIGIVTKSILVLYVLLAVIILVSKLSVVYSFMAFFSMRITEVILFTIIGLSDLKRQQGKGSFYFGITFILKNAGLLLTQKLLAFLIPNWPELQFLSRTAIIIQYLFQIMVEDAFETPQKLKYLFIQPFQLKARFYPLFIFVLLMITSIRVDLIVPFVLGLVCHFAKINNLSVWISIKLDDKFLSERMIQIGFLKTGGQLRVIKPLDDLRTNDSIYLEQK